MRKRRLTSQSPTIDAEDGLSGVDFEFSVGEGQEDGHDTGLTQNDPPLLDTGSETPAAGIARRRIQGNTFVTPGLPLLTDTIRSIAHPNFAIT